MTAPLLAFPNQVEAAKVLLSGLVEPTRQERACIQCQVGAIYFSLLVCKNL
ncbi:MAG: hypothetical protein JOZ78_07520 [Chroococcidiopsidaceae cyanobacterium CP_BM_ER_R8_30]|nr:hypothetical protein [Chroococcidiopsidaceae cyanobacterium CP_BM_ER_R8_30]